MKLIILKGKLDHGQLPPAIFTSGIYIFPYGYTLNNTIANFPGYRFAFHGIGATFIVGVMKIHFRLSITNVYRARIMIVLS